MAIVVIPSRYQSSRFPGKPLADLGGKPIVRWVWECAARTEGVERVIVATDDERILNTVRGFGAEAMLTATTHRSGTDRCGEVLSKLLASGYNADFVINLQGDEPFITTHQIQTLLSTITTSTAAIATLATPITTADELLSPNNVKVVTDDHQRALYFSRQPIPHCRGVEPSRWLSHAAYFKHVGIYAFRADVLLSLCRLAPSTLEQAESLEQLRWLQAGYAISLAVTPHANIGIDTPDDLFAAQQHLAAHPELLSAAGTEPPIER